MLIKVKGAIIYFEVKNKAIVNPQIVNYFYVKLFSCFELFGLLSWLFA